MNIKNNSLESMTSKFSALSLEKQVKALGITDNIVARNKHLPIEKLVMDTWYGLTNSQRRKILKSN